MARTRARPRRDRRRSPRRRGRGTARRARARGTPWSRTTGSSSARRPSARAHLRPRFVMSRFWERLDAEPLGRPFPDGLTSADLVHAHLRRPLGARRSRRGRSDPRGAAGVLGAGPRPPRRHRPGPRDARRRSRRRRGGRRRHRLPGERLLLVDVHLHRAVVTELRQGQEIVRERVSHDRPLGSSTRCTTPWRGASRRRSSGRRGSTRSTPPRPSRPCTIASRAGSRTCAEEDRVPS